MCRYRLISLFLSALLMSSVFVCGRDREAARLAFNKARQYHDQLLRIPEPGRTLRHYSPVIFLYRRVIDHDPTYGGCDDALYAMAELYEEMANRFQKDLYRRRAIHYYDFVAREYPLTRHKSSALERARTLRRNAAVEARQAVEPRPEPPVDLATVTEIRYWSSEDYTRVVIQLDREVQFEKQVLEEPARIYFDLRGTRLRPDLQGKSYVLNDLFIDQIRVAENRPGVIRVVLDFEEIKKHTIFALYDPYRIVIDTHREKGKERAARKEGTARTEEAVISLQASDAGSIKVAEPPVIPSPNLSGDRSLTRVLGLKVGRVVIDPGHGGADTGTIGPDGLREKDLVLAVSLRLKAILEERLGTEVILTRKTDKFVPLEERTAIANQLGADLFVSVHANSSPNRRASGVETFFLNFTSDADEREVASRENASSQKNIRELENLLKQIAFDDYNEESRELAHVIQKHLYSGLKVHRPPLRNRGVKKAPFIVLINLNMPGTLAEVGFISNPAEEKFLRSAKGQSRAADALFTGIEAYLRSLGAIPPYERTAANGSEN